MRGDLGEGETAFIRSSGEELGYALKWDGVVLINDALSPLLV